MSCRIGISMRVVNALDYHDPRDALSQDWYPFLESCGITPVLIPNIEDAVSKYLEDLKVEGIVLSGGNNLCAKTCGGDPSEVIPDTSAARDATERSIIDFAISKGLPILGVCRGMQMLNAYFGGRTLTDIQSQVPGAAEHVACEHEIRFVDDTISRAIGVESASVNSFHNQGLTKTELADTLECIAIAVEDGVVEGLVHKELPILGIEWHPERPHSAPEIDAYLFRSLLVERNFLSEVEK